MGRRRSVGVSVVGALAGLLMLIGSVGAASTAYVKIGESGEKYHFTPTTAFVNVGGKGDVDERIGRSPYGDV